MKKILALDQGTSSTRSVLYNHKGEVLAMSSAVNQIVYKSNGYVEQDPMQLLDAMERAARGALLKAGVSVKDILCMGISVQTGAFVLWEKDGGKPVCPVIGWQDGRGKDWKVYLRIIKRCIVKHVSERFFSAQWKPG